MPRNNRNWSPNEEGLLLQMAADGKSFSLIAKELQRTEAAVSSRFSTVRNRRSFADARVEAEEPAQERHPPPEDELGGGDICSLEWKPPTDDDEPLD